MGRVLAGALIAVLMIIVFGLITMPHGNDSRLLDSVDLALNPDAATTINAQNNDHTEKMAQMAAETERLRIEARRQFNERLLILVGVLGAVGIIAFAAAGRKPVPRVTVSLPPHIRPEQIESFWAAQDEQMRIRGFLVDGERR